MADLKLSIELEDTQGSAKKMGEDIAKALSNSMKNLGIGNTVKHVQKTYVENSTTKAINSTTSSVAGIPDQLDTPIKSKEPKTGGKPDDKKSGTGGLVMAAILGAITGGIGATAGGVVAEAGATTKVVGAIQALGDLVDDILRPFVPIIKMLGVVLSLLFIPLIPILKPILVLLGLLARIIMKWMIDMGLIKSKNPPSALKSIGTAVLGIGGNAILDWLKSINWSQLGANLWAWIQSCWDKIKGIGKWVWDLAIKGWEILKDIGAWIRDTIIIPAFNFLKDVGSWIWTTILQPAFNFLKDVGIWIWEQIIKPAWDFLKDVGSWIWTQIIKPAWDFLKDVGSWIWDILKVPFTWLLDVGQWIWDLLKAPFKDVGDAISGVVNFIKNLGSGIMADIKNAAVNAAKAIGIGGGSAPTTPTVKSGGDFILKPNGDMIKSDPADYLFATKNPQNLLNSKGSGSQVINITINNPTVRNDLDIKTLVRQIEANLIKSKRRYNSYV